MPTEKVRAKARKNASLVASPYHSATGIGSNMVRLKIISSRPRTLATIGKCMVRGSCAALAVGPSVGVSSEEGEADLEELLDLPHALLVHHEHDDVIAGFDHQAVAGDHHLAV